MTCHLRLFDLQVREREREREMWRYSDEKRSQREKEEENRVERRGFDVTMYHCNGRCELQILIAGQ